MIASVYPATLPGPSVSSVTPAERRLLSDVTGGPQQARGVQRDYLGTQRIEWGLLDPTQAAALDSWWKLTLSYGGAWFASTWPAPQGWTSIVRRFIGAPQWAHLPGGYWRASAQVQVRGRGLPPVFNNTVLLMQFDEADGSTAMVDKKGHAAALYSVAGWTAELASVSRSSPIMNSGSLVCQAYQTTAAFSNVACVLPSHTDFDLPADFTIEYSHIGPVLGGSDQYMFGRVVTPNGALNLLWAFSHRNSTVTFQTVVGGTSRTLTGTYTPSALRRYAATRSGDVLRLYIEGSLAGSVSGVTENFSGNHPLCINGPYQTLNPLPNTWSSGKYDEVRITKGEALYTGSTYTLATTPFVN